VRLAPVWAGLLIEYYLSFNLNENLENCSVAATRYCKLTLGQVLDQIKQDWRLLDECFGTLDGEFSHTDGEFVGINGPVLIA
jgi:hypothetical protein